MISKFRGLNGINHFGGLGPSRTLPHQAPGGWYRLIALHRQRHSLFRTSGN
jgi:hypothetical protein